MTRDEVIAKLTNAIQAMDDIDLNHLYVEDGRNIWKYEIRKNKNTSEWELHEW